MEIVVLDKNGFRKYFWTKKTSGIIRRPPCSSRQDVSKYMHPAHKKSSSQFDLRLGPREATWWANSAGYVSADLSMREKHIGTILSTLSPFYQKFES